MPEHAYAISRAAAGLRMYSGIIAGSELYGKKIRGQALDAFKRAEEKLHADGLSLADVLYVTGYLTRAEDFEAYDQVWREIFPSDPPARTTVAARILVDGPLVELSITAAERRYSGPSVLS